MQAQQVKEMTQRFELGTGQLLSPTKCSLLVRENLAQEAKEGICRVLGMEKAKFEVKYLGLPTPDGRLNKDRFQPLKGKYAKRMALWLEKSLSSAGKCRCPDPVVRHQLVMMLRVPSPRWLMQEATQ